MIEHHEEAVEFARAALQEVFPLLPDWGLQNADWTGQYVVLEKRPFYISISPWNVARGGRAFRVWPANSTPAGAPYVEGFLELSIEEFNILPAKFRRPRRQWLGSKW